MKRVLIITAALLATLFCSCQKVSVGEEPSTEEELKECGVSLSLVQEGEFTKAQDVVDVKDFYVKIFKDGELYKSYAKYSQVPSTIELAPGTYKMEAGTQGQSKAAFSQPIFFGSTDVTVAPGAITPVSLVCVLTNVKVTMLYTAQFREAVNDNFEVAVSNGVDANLVFRKSHIDNSISGYFTVTPTLTITLQANRRDNNGEVTHTIVVEDVKARDHIVVTLDVEEIDNTGNVEFGEGGIVVDYKVNPKDEVIIIPGEGEGSGEGSEGGEGEGGEGNEGSGEGEGGEGSGEGEGNEGGDNEGGDEPAYAPEISGSGLDSPLYLTEDQAAANPVVDILFRTLNGKTIKDVVVRIDSPTLTEEFLSDMDLGAAEFSIVNFSNDDAGQTRKSFLEDLGLIDPSKPIAGQSEAKFSIGGLMSMLIAIATPGDLHKFVITVTDSGDVSSTATCTIVKQN